MPRLQPRETPPWQPEPVLEPAFWAQRLAESDGEPHRAVFNGSLTQFREVEQWQREQLRLAGIGNQDSILDAGCGYGRLLDLLSPMWRGEYLGIDVSPEFVAKAGKFYPGRLFLVGDLRDLLGSVRCLRSRARPFDVAVCMWMKGMVTKNIGAEVWEEMEQQLLKVARRLVVVGAPGEE